MADHDDHDDGLLSDRSQNLMIAIKDAAKRAIAHLPNVGMLRHWRARDAKRFWSNHHGPCVWTHLILNALPLNHWQVASVLEFGANWGGNLLVLGQAGAGKLVGIDINPVVKNIGGFGSSYCGLQGDESLLSVFAQLQFDIAFTVSVFDHMADPAAVELALYQLRRIARTVILFEPWIAGIHQDVSHHWRADVAPGFDGRFKPHCYLWDYDAMLERIGASYVKTAHPQHPQSLGPFYHRYVITR
jgi:hypothetical protein